MSQQYSERNNFGNGKIPKSSGLLSPESEGYKISESNQFNTGNSQEKLFSEREVYSSQPKEENFNWRQSQDYNYDTLKSGEYVDLSYPNKRLEEKNYDTKDTIDRQLEELKSSIRKEENTFQFHANHEGSDFKSGNDYPSFQNTLNPQNEQLKDYGPSRDKYDLPQMKFNKTDGKLFEKKSELKDTIGFIKSAAGRKIHIPPNKYTNLNIVKAN